LCCVTALAVLLQIILDCFLDLYIYSHQNWLAGPLILCHSLQLLLYSLSTFSTEAVHCLCSFSLLGNQEFGKYVLRRSLVCFWGDYQIPVGNMLHSMQLNTLLCGQFHMLSFNIFPSQAWIWFINSWIAEWSKQRQTDPIYLNLNFF